MPPLYPPGLLPRQTRSAVLAPCRPAIAMVITALLVPVSAWAQAEPVPDADTIPPKPVPNATTTVPIDIGIWPTLSINGSYPRPVRNYLALSLAYGHSDYLDGLQFSLGVARTDHKVNGIQIGGLASGAGDDLRGAQIAGLVAGVGDDVTALQIGGLFAAAGENATALQAAGLIAGTGEDHVGLQVGGLVAGTGEDLVGLQFGGLVAGTGEDLVGVQVGGLVAGSGGNSTGIQAAVVVAGAGDEFQGIQMGGLVAGSGQRTRGLQVGGAIAGSGGELQGVQLAGLVAGSDRLQGLQASGLLSGTGRGQGVLLSGGATYAKSAFRGLQVALVNIGGTTSGAQVGLVNIARRVNGIQVGLVNVADSVQGAPVGLASWVANAPQHVETWVSDVALFQLGWRTGSRHVYNLWFASVHPLSDQDRIGAGLGLGLHQDLGSFYLEEDLLAQYLIYDYDVSYDDIAANSTLGQLRLRLGYALDPGIALFAGISLNALASADSRKTDVAVGPSALLSMAEQHVRLWTGFFAGLRVTPAGWQ